MIKRHMWIVVLAAELGGAIESVQAQCAWWDGFMTTPSSKGLNGNVYAMAVWDADGPGPNPPALYVGGNFTKAGTVAVNSIAKWDGTNWSALGTGIPNVDGWADVYTMIVWDDGSGPALFVGGAFKTAGGKNVNSIAKWNGAVWSALGAGIAELAPGTPGQVNALAGYGGSLYVGGYFFGAGTSGASYIARWSPTGGWENPATDGIDGDVEALAVFNGKLYAGGGMHFMGTTATEHIAVFDGTTWSGVGGGLSGGGCETLAVWNDGGGAALYAGGDFTSAGGGAAQCLARWDGSGWSSLGGITNTSGPADVRALTAYDDGTGPGLVVGGFFNRAGSVAATCLAYYQRGTWSGIGGGAGDVIRAATVFDNDGTGPDPANLFIGGQFGYVGVSGGAMLAESAHIARWFDRDSDHDGILDCWETSGKGIDVDHDGVVDLDLYSKGARVDHKDIFVEVDVMDGVTVDPDALDDVVKAFAAAPKELVSNPDNKDGVVLHVERDPADTGIAYLQWTNMGPTGTWPVSFDTNKAAHFGTKSEQSQPKVLAAKRLVYRYCIFGYSYGVTRSSGLSEIGGNDFMVTLGRWSVRFGTRNQQAGTFMHELGHTLGLHHGGGQSDPASDNRYNFKPNYHSVMNYTWQTPALVLAHPPATTEEQTYADSWRLDYSRSAMGPLDEADLSEPAGISGGNSLFLVPAGPPPFRLVPESDFVDWNRNNSTSDTGVVRDINRLWMNLAASADDRLNGYVDWSNLQYNFRDNPQYADGVHDNVPANELTQEIVDLLAQRPNGCHCDFNRDLQIDLDDLAIFLACATGPAVPYQPDSLPAGCTLAADGEGRILADSDRDGDVDLDDYGILQQCYTEPDAASPG